jgi:hypothetical protein
MLCGGSFMTAETLPRQKLLEADPYATMVILPFAGCGGRPGAGRGDEATRLRETSRRITDRRSAASRASVASDRAKRGGESAGRMRWTPPVT